MASRATTLPRQKTSTTRGTKKSSQRSSVGWWMWLPVVAGVVATPFAVRYAEILPLLGTSGLMRLRMLYPLAMLAHQPQLGLVESTADAVAQALMYAEFPLYGLLAALVLWRAGFLRAVLTVVCVHVLAFGAVWLFAQM